MTDSSPTPRDPATDLARGTAVNLGGFVARIVLVFAHGILAARWLGAESYGRYAAGVAIVGLASFTGQLGLGRTLTRFVAVYHAAGDRHRMRELLGAALFLGLVSCGVLGIVLARGAESIARWSGDPELGRILRLMAPAVPALCGTTLLAAFTQGLGRMRDKALAVDIGVPAVELLALLVLLALGRGAVALPLAYEIALAVSATSLAVIVFRPGGDLARAVQAAQADPQAPSLRDAARFSASVWILEVLAELRNRAGVLLLGAFSTAGAVGIFSVAQRVVGLGTLLLYSLNLMLAPLVARLTHAGQTKELVRLSRLATRWILAASLPSYLLLVAFRHEVMGVFGPEFAVGSAALVILTVGVILDLSTGPAGVVLMMSGRPHLNAINEGVRVLGLLAAGLLLVPRFGMEGAAWAVTAATAVFALMQGGEVWATHRLHPLSPGILRVFGASGLMALSLFVGGAVLSRGPVASPIVPVLLAAVSLGVYGGALWLLRLEADEVRLIRATISRWRAGTGRRGAAR